MKRRPYSVIRYSETIQWLLLDYPINEIWLRRTAAIQ